MTTTVALIFGFSIVIGCGLLACGIQTAAQNLSAYLNEPEDDEDENAN